MLVNATSLGEHKSVVFRLLLTRFEGSRSLIGVEDTALYPIRGQSIIVQHDGLQEFLSSRSGQFGALYHYSTLECVGFHRGHFVGRTSYIYHSAPWTDLYEHCTSKWNLSNR